MLVLFDDVLIDISQIEYASHSGEVTYVRLPDELIYLDGKGQELFWDWAEKHEYGKCGILFCGIPVEDLEGEMLEEFKQWRERGDFPLFPFGTGPTEGK